jgi:hypothetical protein
MKPFGSLSNRQVYYLTKQNIISFALNKCFKEGELEKNS